MNYQAINALLFALYMVGCGAAFWLASGRKQNWEQTAVYAITVMVFYAMSHAPVELGLPSYRMGPVWYLVNAGVHFYIVAYAWRAKADSSLWILRIGCAETALDLIYFAFAYIDHKLPGIGYFVGSSTCESLQVLMLILFSGPVLPALRKIPHRLAGALHWLIKRLAAERFGEIVLP